MRALPLTMALVALGGCMRTVPTIVPVALEGPEKDAPRAVSAPAAPASPAIEVIGAAPPERLAAPVDALAVRLIIPVAGVSATEMRDSFDADREDGARKHHAIDILAPRNTPVLAADHGRVLRLSTNELGGTTVYAVDTENRFVYYYAHLERYHPGVEAGRALAKGDTIGYVGTSGNAPKDTPHLHFQVMLMPADGKYWNGEPVNPYPLLRR